MERPWTPYQCDLAPVPPPSEAPIILRQSIPDRAGDAGEVVYALQDGSLWLVFRLDTARGTSQAAREPYRCFIEAKRAVDAQTVAWESPATTLAPTSE